LPTLRPLSSWGVKGGGDLGIKAKEEGRKDLYRLSNKSRPYYENRNGEVRSHSPGTATCVLEDAGGVMELHPFTYTSPVLQSCKGMEENRGRKSLGATWNNKDAKRGLEAGPAKTEGVRGGPQLNSGGGPDWKRRRPFR